MKAKIPETILKALRRGGQIRAAQITRQERQEFGRRSWATRLARARAQEASQKGAL
jgi:hypothetical protein